MGEFEEDADDESEIDEEDKDDAFDAVSSKESDVDEDDSGGTFVGGILSFIGVLFTLQSTRLSLIIYDDDYSRF
ncbi:MAG: hypothetical protein ACI90V_013541 [Bacillariaceae sp.]|jgi:hypothetical protein